MDTNEISILLRDFTCLELTLYRNFYEEFTDFVIEGGYSDYENFVSQQTYILYYI